MAPYAIGDVQGCYDELRALLTRVGFDAPRDRLWFVGDLVNRGPKSLEVLRFVRGLGDRAVVVLGNHDLHLVCLAEGLARARDDDTLDAVLAAPDMRDLVDWLRTRPLVHVEGRHAMVHAGLLPQWTLDKAKALAGEVEAALRPPNYRDCLAALYGSKPARWDDALSGWDRLRVIVNAMTRMRFCSPEGVMDFHVKSDKAPAGVGPWFEARPPREEPMIVCGHWSALGLRLTPRVSALDAGCVCCGSLSAPRLDDGDLSQLACDGYHAVAEE